VKLGGACVDPIADATQRSPHHVPPVTDPARVDIDDDGEADWIVTMDADAYAYHGYLYVTRGACAHYVGSWDGLPPTPSDNGAHGLRDLEQRSPCKRNCCPSLSVRLLRFDGRLYHQVSERTVNQVCGTTAPVPSP
jgi:hypothetical protein